MLQVLMYNTIVSGADQFVSWIDKLPGYTPQDIFAAMLPPYLEAKAHGRPYAHLLKKDENDDLEGLVEMMQATLRLSDAATSQDRKRMAGERR